MTTPAPILESRVDLAEHKRNIWFASAPLGVEPEHLLAEGYWAVVARQLRPLDEIICTSDECKWRVVLLVEDAWNTGARVQELSRQKLMVTEDSVNDQGLRIQWRGPHAKWCVVRKDGATMKEGLPSREIALQHMQGMLNQRVA